MTTLVRLPFSVLGVDFAPVLVPAGVDSDPLEGEFDLFRPQREQLAEAQPGVHCGGPQRLITLL